MKKFVSLVLVLALALSLCTVAFAVVNNSGTTKTVTVDFEKATIASISSTSGIGTSSSLAGKTITKVTTSGVVVDDEDYYYADWFVIDDQEYSVVTKDYADYLLTIDGVKYFVVDQKVFTKVVFTKAIAEKDEPSCGDYDVDVFVDEDGNAYEDAASNNWAYLNGTFVTYKTGTVEANPHTFKADSDKNTYKLDSKNNRVPVTAYCTTCKKSFNVVTKLDKEWEKDVNYVDAPAFADVKPDTYYVVLDTAVGGSTTTTTTVDSSKTFDAGVAMYVGLSLMSVAGSAVVIGKKKEF